MRLEYLGSNRAVLKFADNFADTLHVFFAYNVPVACYQYGVGYFVTTAYYNRATKAISRRGSTAYGRTTARKSNSTHCAQ